MKLAITRNGTVTDFEGTKTPHSFELLSVEVVRPNSLRESTGAMFDGDVYKTFPVFERAGKWGFSFLFPSWLPTEGDGFVGLDIFQSSETGFQIHALFGRFKLSWASEDFGKKPTLFTNRLGFSFCTCFATGIGG